MSWVILYLLIVGAQPIVGERRLNIGEILRFPVDRHVVRQKCHQIPAWIKDVDGISFGVPTPDDIGNHAFVIKRDQHVNGSIYRVLVTATEQLHCHYKATWLEMVFKGKSFESRIKKSLEIEKTLRVPFSDLRIYELDNDEEYPGDFMVTWPVECEEDPTISYNYAKTSNLSFTKLKLSYGYSKKWEYHSIFEEPKKEEPRNYICLKGELCLINLKPPRRRRSVPSHSCNYPQFQVVASHNDSADWLYPLNCREVTGTPTVTGNFRFLLKILESPKSTIEIPFIVNVIPRSTTAAPTEETQTEAVATVSVVMGTFLSFFVIAILMICWRVITNVRNTKTGTSAQDVEAETSPEQLSDPELPLAAPM